MARPKKVRYEYIDSSKLYRKRIKDADGKYVAFYAKTEKTLEQKLQEATRRYREIEFIRNNPTVAAYAATWLDNRSGIKYTTIVDYTSIVNNYIVDTIGQKYLCQLRPDDIKYALKKAASKSETVYKKSKMLINAICQSAVENHYMAENPCVGIDKRGGTKAKDKIPLSDEEVKILLDSVEGHRVHTFVALGLFAGLRREEILALKWDSVVLDGPTPVIYVRRAWHLEHNRPVISDELKTKASKRTIPIPQILVDILKESREKFPSEYVVPNNEGGPLTGTQWSRLWKYVTIRMVREHFYYTYDDAGNRIKHVVSPVLGEHAKHNNTCVYTINFRVTPHVLRHTYATNLLASGVDMKTVQYLLGHERASTTLDIYVHLKYNKPEDILPEVEKAFS